MKVVPETGLAQMSLRPCRKCELHSVLQIAIMYSMQNEIYPGITKVLAAYQSLFHTGYGRFNAGIHFRRALQSIKAARRGGTGPGPGKPSGPHA